MPTINNFNNPLKFCDIQLTKVNFAYFQILVDMFRGPSALTAASFIPTKKLSYNNTTSQIPEISDAKNNPEEEDESGMEVVTKTIYKNFDGTPVEKSELNWKIELSDPKFENTEIIIDRDDKEKYVKIFKSDNLSEITILGFSSMDDSRIPSVSVNNSTWFMFGENDSPGGF